MADKFYDSGGDECTLEELCHREPGWAANRIRHERAQLAALRKALAAAEELAAKVHALKADDNSWTKETEMYEALPAFDAAMAEVRKGEGCE